MIQRLSIHQSLPYKEILDIQIKEFNNRVNCRKDGVPLPGDIVLFVEHLPVYTLGLHGNRNNLLLSENILEREGIEFYQINRGGDITYHGPGQLTVYPIIDLLRYNLGVKDYVNILEESVIQTLDFYSIRGERIEGKTGVWIGKDTPNERKICAIGIKCSRYVSMHGLALNVGNEMENFRGIVPCGLSQGVTSIALETGKDVDIFEVENILWNKLTSLLLLRTPFQENS